MHFSFWMMHLRDDLANVLTTVLAPAPPTAQRCKTSPVVCALSRRHLAAPAVLN